MDINNLRDVVEEVKRGTIKLPLVIELLEKSIDLIELQEKQIDLAEKAIIDKDKAINKAVDVLSTIKGLSVYGMGDNECTWKECIEAALYKDNCTIENDLNKESDKDNGK